MTRRPRAPNLGPCCICEGTGRVIHIFLLPWRGPVAGHGWGCLVCGLPPDGATAVVCRMCVRRNAGDLHAITGALRFACRGEPGTDGRMPIGDFGEPFGHDPSVIH